MLSSSLCKWQYQTSSFIQASFIEMEVFLTVMVIYSDFVFFFFTKQTGVTEVQITWSKIQFTIGSLLKEWFSGAELNGLLVSLIFLKVCRQHNQSYSTF